ncbi:mannose-6-phosphate isomerase [Apibacter muscae]|uniref:type I phosphomannose isomerase catalytic subunit n=1 Tax=Apibacter muscae TaxID=2509004 RepID=UPI0011AD9E13|nr:type I phosphomannose isomerase catalytic subunit [Apibacter muscae]TWP24109.1 mannose-6-phosphate isomerase [Apibacter muscae]
MSLYPLIFYPSLHYRIWGGNKLKTLGKKVSDDKIGESWEISSVPNFISKVSNGFLKDRELTELINVYKEDLVGSDVYNKFGNNFPLLIKFLDTHEPLSVQVHPDDIYGKKHHNSWGKTEMWYVIDADKDSEIILGFEKNMTQEKFFEKLKANDFDGVFRKVYPKKGDVFYIPAGRVHALGKGLLIAEIQQSSDITYRIYDYDRLDKNGKKRELHIEEAKAVIDFSYIENVYSTYNPQGLNECLVHSPYFNVNKHNIAKNYIFKDLPTSFKIFILLEGRGSMSYNQNQSIFIEKGQSILIPACLKNIEIISEKDSPITLLEVHL